MFFVSIGLTLIAIVCVFIFGLKFGVDFKGGSVIELEFKDGRPEMAQIQKVLTDQFPIKDLNLSSLGDKGLIIRSGELSEENHQLILRRLETNFENQIEEKKFDSVGPVVGNELKRKSITAIILVLIGILSYIAFVFRKLSKVLSPWSMGVAAIVALVHDLFIPFGVFALLGYYYGVEIGGVFVAAALTILGFSVSDTVVVFDRVRENVLKEGLKDGFPAIVHKSVMQTLVRSLNTTFTTLLSLVAIYFFGGESIRYFALALIIGIFLGAYSSIFIASPLLVWWSKLKT
ncbi:MAG: protein translocase subunit SecF [Parcubacteria group bacterium]|nr:protein translocase subunit SecF [Parcubacteria group bacterium]